MDDFKKEIKKYIKDTKTKYKKANKNSTYVSSFLNGVDSILEDLSELVKKYEKK